MNLTGTYAYRNGGLVKISDRIPMKGTPTIATKSFAEQAMHGYRRCEEKGQRFLGSRAGIQRIWDRTAKLKS